MIPSLLVAVSACIVGLLGTAHLVLTYVGPKLLPRDRTLRAAMEATTPVITRQTTYWRVWIGFNASHSLGAILFGLVYGYLALIHPDWLFGSIFLQAVGVVMLAAYVVLGKLYWFITPFAGMTVSFLCFAVGIALG